MKSFQGCDTSKLMVHILSSIKLIDDPTLKILIKGLNFAALFPLFFMLGLIMRHRKLDLDTAALGKILLHSFLNLGREKLSSPLFIIIIFF